MKLPACLPILLMAVLTAGSAMGQGISSSDPQSLLRELQAMNHDVRLAPYDSGRPRIRGRLAGFNYAIAFYSCLEDHTDCRGLLFTAGFDMTDGTAWDLVNRWNRESVYTRACLDDENDPFVQMPVPIARDFDTGDVARMMDLWESELVDFTDEIGFKRRAPERRPPGATAPGRLAPQKIPGNRGLGGQ